jgi:hypothetical protein
MQNNRFYTQSKPQIQRTKSFQKAEKRLSKVEQLSKANKNEVNVAKKIEKKESEQVVDESQLNLLRLHVLAMLVNQFRTTDEPTESEQTNV